MARLHAFDWKKQAEDEDTWRSKLVKTINSLISRVQGSSADGVEGLESRVTTLEGQVPVTLTPVAASSGTSVTLNNTIPAGVNWIILTPNAVTTNGTSSPIIQLGPSGGPVTSGYSGSIGWASASAQDSENHTNGFRFNAGHAADEVLHGVMTLIHRGSNIWSYGFTGGRSDAAVGLMGGGTVDVGGTLTQIVATTVGGVNSFDGAGSFGIQYGFTL